MLVDRYIHIHIVYICMYMYMYVYIYIRGSFEFVVKGLEQQSSSSSIRNGHRAISLLRRNWGGMDSQGPLQCGIWYMVRSGHIRISDQGPMLSANDSSCGTISLVWSFFGDRL